MEEEINEKLHGFFINLFINEDFKLFLTRSFANNIEYLIESQKD